MNDIQLSNDINIITAEINSYKQVAGQAIFEIGKRMKHVKENDLVHGEWESWCNSVDFTRGHANKFIKVYEEIGTNVSSMSHLGVAALYEIATLPKEEREKEHTTSKGETKTVDEMTVRELQEIKRQLRESEQAKQQAEKQVEQAKKSEEIALRKLEDEQSKEPEIIEKEIIKNVIPDDYKKLKELERSINQKDRTDKEYEREKRRKETLQLQADNDVLSLANNIDDFLKENAVTSYREGAIASSDEMTKETLKECISALKNFTNEIERSLHGRIKI